MSNLGVTCNSITKVTKVFPMIDENHQIKEPFNNYLENAGSIEANSQTVVIL